MPNTDDMNDKVSRGMAEEELLREIVAWWDCIRLAGRSVTFTREYVPSWLGPARAMIGSFTPIDC